MDNLENILKPMLEEIVTHREDIVELSVISAKLTQLVELQTSQSTTQSEHINSIAKEMAVMRSEMNAQLKKTNSEPASKVWYESDTGKLVVKTCCIILVIIVGAAVGINALDKIPALTK